METTTETPRAETTTDTAGKLDVDAAPAGAAKVVKLRQVQVPSTVAERMTFGVEIECFLPVTAIQEAGITVGGYHHGAGLPVPLFPRGWTAEHDGSLRTSLPGYRPVEIVSPILRGREGLDQVREVLARLRAMNGRVNATTGLHCHVGLTEAAGPDREAQAAFVENFVHLVAQHETALWAAGGSRRRAENYYYCRSVRTDAYRDVATRIRRASGSRKVAALAGHGLDRYRSVNLCSMSQHGTLEVRIFPGSLAATKVLASLQLVLGLAEKALGRRARFDPPATHIYRGKGAGAAALDRLFYLLGLTLGRKEVGRPTCTVLGWLDDIGTLDAAKAELRRLARKFDAAGEPEEQAEAA